MRATNQSIILFCQDLRFWIIRQSRCFLYVSIICIIPPYKFGDSIYEEYTCIWIIIAAYEIPIYWMNLFIFLLTLRLRLIWSFYAVKFDYYLRSLPRSVKDLLIHDLKLSSNTSITILAAVVSPFYWVTLSQLHLIIASNTNCGWCAIYHKMIHL